MGKKVFSVYMGDPDSSSHSELDLPATPWELIDALDKLRLEDGRESYWQVEDIGRYPAFWNTANSSAVITPAFRAASANS